MKKNFWKVSTFVLAAIIVAYTGFVLTMVYLVADDEADMETMVNPMADIPTAGEAEYTEDGNRIITAADMQLMIQQMNKASSDAQQQVSTSMGAVTGAVDEINKAIEDPNSEINSFADNITALIMAVKKDLPELEEKLKELQANIEAKVAEATKEIEQFTPEKNSDVKTPDNK